MYFCNIIFFFCLLFSFLVIPCLASCCVSLLSRLASSGHVPSLSSFLFFSFLFFSFLFFSFLFFSFLFFFFFSFLFFALLCFSFLFFAFLFFFFLFFSFFFFPFLFFSYRIDFVQYVSEMEMNMLNVIPPNVRLPCI